MVIFFIVKHVISDVKNILKDTEHPEHFSEKDRLAENGRRSGLLYESKFYEK